MPSVFVISDAQRLMDSQMKSEEHSFIHLLMCSCNYLLCCVEQVQWCPQCLTTSGFTMFHFTDSGVVLLSLYTFWRMFFSRDCSHAFSETLIKLQCAVDISFLVNLGVFRWFFSSDNLQIIWYITHQILQCLSNVFTCLSDHSLKSK